MSQPVSKSASALGGGVVVQKQKSGVYTVLLFLALLATLVGCAFLYGVIQTYDGQFAPPAAVSQLFVPGSGLNSSDVIGCFESPLAEV